MSPTETPPERMPNSGHTAWKPEETPLAILAEGCFGESQSKLALGVIRYGAWPVVTVIDSRFASKTVREVTGIPCDAPIVANLEAALAYAPKALLIGTAPAGGKLPSEWWNVLAEALRNGLHVLNGLHVFLSEEPELSALARQYGVRLWDVRDPCTDGKDRFREINRQQPRPPHVRTVAMVGSDCSVGKMHTALELDRQAGKRGHSSAFVATGQTGILIAGRGVPLDRVIGDFMAGALESCILEDIARLEQQAPGRPHTLFIEGQGSLLHPAYSGVTLSLLHGANPDAMIFCHKADLTAIRHYPQIPLPPLGEIIAAYEHAASWARPHGQPAPRVVGISVNTSMLPETEAVPYLERVSRETGLPAKDPVRYGVSVLLEALGLS